MDFGKVRNYDVQRLACQAKKKLGRSVAERRAFWTSMRAYECPICHGWHLTSQVRNQQERR